MGEEIPQAYFSVEVKSTGDNEIDAISICLAALKNHDAEAKKRIARYIFAFVFG